MTTDAIGLKRYTVEYTRTITLKSVREIDAPDQRAAERWADMLQDEIYGSDPPPMRDPLVNDVIDVEWDVEITNVEEVV